ncbi:MAG: hypothetical protein J0M12_04250 [Deltaproteobacteria bacterium]|nr:hypothetical protein [Deltaproteobacteria bacterium]
MKTQLKFRYQLLSLGLLALSFVAPAHGQFTEGTWGFNSIGNDIQAITGAECKQSMNSINLADYKRLTAIWNTPSTYPQYSFNQFRAVIGLMPDAIQGVSGNPATSADYKLYVYDDFNRFLANPVENYRVKFTFSRPFSSAVNFQLTGTSGQTCGNFGCITNIPLYYATFNLKNPTSVTYKDTVGNITATPFRLNGGRQYFFSLVGDGWSSATGYPCVVRTKSNQPGYFSPPPSPALSFPMVGTQCASAGLPPGCNFSLAHSEFYSMSAESTNPNLAPVQWYQGVSPWGPYFTTAGGPLACAYNSTSLPCARRTYAGRTAYHLSITPYYKYLTIQSDSLAVAMTAVAACADPNC